jgi:transposase
VTVDKETEAEIRRLFFGEHWKQGTIVTQLGVHKDVVARVVGPHGPEPQGRDPRPSVLDPYRGLVLETLERYPTLVATRVYDMISERGYTGSLQTLQRFVLPNRPARPSEVYMRVETLAGEQSTGPTSDASASRAACARFTASSCCCTTRGQSGPSSCSSRRR